MEQGGESPTGSLSLGVIVGIAAAAVVAAAAGGYVLFRRRCSGNPDPPSAESRSGGVDSDDECDTLDTIAATTIAEAQSLLGSTTMQGPQNIWDNLSDEIC
jgi:hypothetical protein